MDSIAVVGLKELFQSEPFEFPKSGRDLASFIQGVACLSTAVEFLNYAQFLEVLQMAVNTTSGRVAQPGDVADVQLPRFVRDERLYDLCPGWTIE